MLVPMITVSTHCTHMACPARAGVRPAPWTWDARRSAATLRAARPPPPLPACRCPAALALRRVPALTATRPACPCPCPCTALPCLLQVWLGAFPIVINQWAAIAITVYYTATLVRTDAVVPQRG